MTSLAIEAEHLVKKFGDQTAVDDVSFDLISVQYHSLKAGHDYGQYVRDAENAGRDDIAALDAPQIDAMFRGFQVLDRSIRDEDGRFQADKKHWHVITTLARKTA